MIVLKNVLFFFLLVGVMLLAIQTPPVQHFMVNRATSYLEKKLGTRVRIGGFSLSFPKTVIIEKVYIEDLKHDTLLYAGKIRLSVNITKMLSGDLEVNKIKLQQTTANVNRMSPDSVFNFQFMLDAFLPAEKRKTDADSISLQASIRHVELDEVRVIYNDMLTALDLDLGLGHLETDIDVSDMNARFNNLLLKDTRLNFRNNLLGVHDSINLGELQLDRGSIDVAHKLVELNKLRLDRTTVVLRIDSRQSTPSADTSTQSLPIHIDAGWGATVANLRLNNNSFQIENNNIPPKTLGIDFAHLAVQSLTLHIDTLKYLEGVLSGNIVKAGFKERSGFSLTQLQTDFSYHQRQLDLKRLTLLTPGTELHHSITLRFPSADPSKSDTGEIGMDIDIADSKIHVKDLLSFAPSLRVHRAFADSNNTIGITRARCKGTLSHLQIEALDLHAFHDTKIRLQGVITNLPDLHEIGGDLTITEVRMSRNDLLSLVPNRKFLTSINIPQWIRFTGSVSGTINNFDPHLLLQTPIGDVRLNGTVQHATIPSKASYQLSVQTTNLGMNLLVPAQSDVGLLNADFTATGTGLDTNTASVKLDGVITSVEYKQNMYRSLPIHARITNDQFKVRTNIQYIRILPGILRTLIRKPVFRLNSLI